MQTEPYRIALIIHEGEELFDEINFQPVPCWARDHPQYLEARAIDDERCPACGRDVARGHLRLIAGGRRS